MSTAPSPGVVRVRVAARLRGGDVPRASGSLGEDGIAVELTHGDPPPRSRGTGHRRVMRLGDAGSEPDRQTSVRAASSGSRSQNEPARQTSSSSSRQVERCSTTGSRRAAARRAGWHSGVTERTSNEPRAIAASEWVKRPVSRRPHWWFAHTEGVPSGVYALSAFRRSGSRSSRTRATRRALRGELNGSALRGTGDPRATLGVTGPDDRTIPQQPVSREAPGLPPGGSRPRARDHAGVPLVIGGDGPDRDEAETAAARQSHVVYAGRLDGRAKGRAAEGFGAPC